MNIIERRSRVKARLKPGQKVTSSGYSGVVVRLYSDGPVEGARIYEVRLPGGVVAISGSDIVPVKASGRDKSRNVRWYETRQDRAREVADRYAYRARRAAEAGKYDLARKLADKARALRKSGEKYAHAKTKVGKYDPVHGWSDRDAKKHVEGVGKRIQLHPGTDRWMMGDRYGVIVGKSRKPGVWRVKLDRSGKTVLLHERNIGEWL